MPGDMLYIVHQRYYKHLLDERGITQGQLASRLGVDEGDLSKRMRNAGRHPDADLLYEVARELNTVPTWLATEHRCPSRRAGSGKGRIAPPGGLDRVRRAGPVACFEFRDALVAVVEAALEVQAGSHVTESTFFGGETSRVGFTNPDALERLNVALTPFLVSDEDAA